MYRRPIASCLALVVATIVLNVDAQDANAQRLLRRLQDRIQSRLAVPPPPQPALPNSQAIRPPVIPSSTVQPKRVQPISPAARPATPSRTPAVSSNKQADNAPQRSKFGSSILAPQESSDAFSSREDASDGDTANTGPTARPSLGIEVYESRGGVPGVQVVRFRDDSLADEAGLQIGDVIVEMDGTRTPTIADVASQITGKRFGQKVKTRILRGKEAKDIFIPLVGDRNLVAKPADSQESFEIVTQPEPVTAGRSDTALLGLEIEDAKGLRGVVVTEVEPNTPAAAAGLQVGDRIVALDGGIVRDSQSLMNELAERGSNDTLSLRLVRDGGLVSTDVDLGNTGQSGLAAAGDQPTLAAPGESKKNGSTLEGIGSMLGGFFGGKSNSKANTKKSGDVMALGDDEPVRQVGFDEKTEVVNPFTQEASALDADAKDANGLTSDPPSLDVLELPPGKAEPIELVPPAEAERVRAEKLREEIRQLEQRLQELQAKEATDK